jgi:hypothetical protein
MYDINKKRKKEEFIQEQLQIEEYPLMPILNEKKEEDKPERGVVIIQL